jgi:hypothetical protein
VDSRIVAGRQRPFAQLQQIHTLSANCEFAHYRISHVQRKSGLTGRTAASPKMVGGRLRAVSDNDEVGSGQIAAPCTFRREGRIPAVRCRCEVVMRQWREPTFKLPRIRGCAASWKTAAAHRDRSCKGVTS